MTLPSKPKDKVYTEEWAGIFRSSFNIIQTECRAIAADHGWDTKARESGTLIALMHSELSEALEAFRHGNLPSDHIPQYSGAEEEFADVIIRIMDMAEVYGLKISDAVIAKLEFNRGREFRHGNKKF